MSFILLIMERSDSRRSRPAPEGRQAYSRMVRYAEDLQARGLLIASESLKSDAEGLRLETRDGKRRLVDGPFTESKEIVGGFFLLSCETREQAVALASECPAAEWATVEVREVGPCYCD